MQLKPAVRKPLCQRLAQSLRLRLTSTVADSVIGIALERDVRVLPLHPSIERVVKKEIRQHGADD